MRYIGKSVVVLMLMISSLCVCSCMKKPIAEISLVRANPNGTEEEQIQYHKNEIRKYRAAVEREEQNVHRSLSQHRMSDVRQAYNRKEQYLKRIEQHMQSLEKLSHVEG